MKTLRYIGVIIFLMLFLFPYPAGAANDGDLRLKTVVIDPGHGGKDPGCVSRDGRVLEKNINLDIAKKLGAKISATYPDVKVVYTRSTDVYVTLNNRAAIANRNNANLFISIHVNAAASTQAHGFSTHILGYDKLSSNMDVCRRENSVIMLEEDYTTDYQGFDPNDPESFIFFNLMQNAFYEQSLTYAAEADREMSKGPVKHSRGVSQDPFWVLWSTKMPAVLVEVGFMSNASDLKLLNSSSGRTEIAQRLFDAFRSFKTKYDASIDFAAEPAVRPADNENQDAGATGRTEYGVQIFVLSKQLKKNDKAFKGYDAVAIKTGNMYKYIIKVSAEADARALFKKTRKIFPGSFPVKIENGSVSAL